MIDCVESNSRQGDKMEKLSQNQVSLLWMSVGTIASRILKNADTAHNLENLKKALLELGELRQKIEENS